MESESFVSGQDHASHAAPLPAVGASLPHSPSLSTLHLPFFILQPLPFVPCYRDTVASIPFSALLLVSLPQSEEEGWVWHGIWLVDSVTQNHIF